MKKLFYLLLTFQFFLLSPQIVRADKDHKKGSVPPNHITVTNVFLRDTTAMLPYVGTNTNAEEVGGETETVTPFDVYGDPRDGRPPVVEIITTPFSVGMPTFQLPNFDNLAITTSQTTEQADIVADLCLTPSQIEVRAYPNPVTELLNVSFSDNQPYTVSLINAAGQLVSTINTNGNNNITIQVGHLPKGIYLLLVDDGKQPIVKKVEILH